MIFPKVSAIDLVGCIPHSISTISSGFLLKCLMQAAEVIWKLREQQTTGSCEHYGGSTKKYARFDELGFWFPQEKQNIKSPSHRALYFESQSYFEAKFLDSSVPMVKFTRSSWFEHSVHNSFIFHDYSALNKQNYGTSTIFIISYLAGCSWGITMGITMVLNPTSWDVTISIYIHLYYV